MNEDYVVTTVLMNDLLKVVDHQDYSRAQVKGTEIKTMAAGLAKYLQKHLERTLYVFVQWSYVTPLSV